MIQILFDNGGGITIQTPDFCHYYGDPAQAAADARAIFAGDSTEEWDGNEPEGRMSDEQIAEFAKPGHDCVVWDVADLAAINPLAEINGHARREFVAAWFNRREHVTAHWKAEHWNPATQTASIYTYTDAAGEPITLTDSEADTYTWGDPEEVYDTNGVLVGGEQRGTR